MNAVVAYFLEYNRYLNFVGIAVVLGIAWVFSRHRTHVNTKLVINALLMQGAIAFIVLRTRVGQGFIQACADGVRYLYTYAEMGTRFIFGNIAVNQAPWGPVFAIQILPMIIFFGAFMALLFHYGIVQKVVYGLGKVVRPILGTTGAETLCAVANSFLGQTEAPLLIRHYLVSMTDSEMLVVMVSGMATLSGSILAVYASFGVPIEHLLASSVIAIPGAIMMAKILLPEITKPVDADKNLVVEEVGAQGNVFEALATGTSDGLSLTLNVAAMLLSFYALMQLINGCLGGASGLITNYIYSGFPALTLNSIFSTIFSPFGYLMGFTGSEGLKIGQLIGTKVAINEFFAYRELVGMHLSPRAVTIATYALCGFSNFSSIGIQVGGIGALVPSKRKVLTQLGLTALLGGALTNILTAFIAGLFI